MKREELKSRILKVLSIGNLFQRNLAQMAEKTEVEAASKKSLPLPSTSLNKKRGKTTKVKAEEEMGRSTSEEGVISNKNKEFQTREKIKFPFLVLPLPNGPNKDFSLYKDSESSKDLV